SDPRASAQSPEEVGRGPVAENVGRFAAVRQTIDGVVLEYEAGGAMVREHMQEVRAAGDRWVFARHCELESATRPLWLVLGTTAADVSIKADGAGVSLQKISAANNAVVWTVHIPAHQRPATFSATFARGDASGSISTTLPTK